MRSCAVRQCLTRCLSVPASVSVVSVTVLQSFLMSRSEKYSGMKNACEIDMSENDCTVLCVHCVCATNLSQTCANLGGYVITSTMRTCCVDSRAGWNDSAGTNLANLSPRLISFLGHYPLALKVRSNKGPSQLTGEGSLIPNVPATRAGPEPAPFFSPPWPRPWHSPPRVQYGFFLLTDPY